MCRGTNIAKPQKHVYPRAASTKPEQELRYFKSFPRQGPRTHWLLCVTTGGDKVHFTKILCRNPAEPQTPDIHQLLPEWSVLSTKQVRYFTR